MIYYVSCHADITGDGTRMRPFMTIQEAANLAGPGDVVLVEDGLYREHVHPLRSGTKDAPVVFRAVHPRKAVITGAEFLPLWSSTGERTPAGDPIWQTEIPDDSFGEDNPFSTLLYGDWISIDHPLHTAMLFIDDEPLREVSDRAQILSPPDDRDSFEEKKPAGFWFAESENGVTHITATFGSLDPSAHSVEAAVRSNCFMPATNGINYITLDGFVCTKAATQWAPPTAYQDGAVGPHWAKGWCFRNCEISWSRCVGISLGKYLQPENDNKWSRIHRKHGTQTERDAVCKAVNDGWSKDTIGSHVIAGCEIHDCGQAGIAGHMGGAFSTIEDNHIHHIGVRRDFAGAEIAGIKLHAAIDTQISRNHIHHCIRGLWLDWQAQGTRVHANLFHDNMPFRAKPEHPAFGEDLFIEVSHGPTLVDNNILLSAHAAKLATQGIAFVHNLIAGSFTSVGAGTDNKATGFPSERYTPYHVPHSTAIAGFMTILHGDARFFNNLFIQNVSAEDKAVDEINDGSEQNTSADTLVVGTKPYDGYPSPSAYFEKLDNKPTAGEDRNLFYDHLPVEASGNRYYNGAMPYDGETDPFICGEPVTLMLEDDEDGLYLVTDLYRHRSPGPCRMINSSVLGEAFEPEQRFEAPDGSDIEFLTDYHGRHRGLQPACGPFEMQEMQFSRIPLIKRFSYTDEPVTLEPNTVGENRHADERWSKPRSDEEGNKREVDANLVLVNCESCTFPLSGVSFTVREVYIRGNEVWIRSVENPTELVHMDCAYGIFKRHAVSRIRAPFSLDVTEDRNLMGLVNMLATQYRILARSMVQDPETVCRRIRDKVNETMQPAGIEMRFTPEMLKFIRNKKFITLEEVVDTVASPDQDVMAEIIADE